MKTHGFSAPLICNSLIQSFVNQQTHIQGWERSDMVVLLELYIDDDFCLFDVCELFSQSDLG